MAYEDNYWLNVYYLYTSKAYVIDKIYYHYWINPDSTITSFNSNYHLDRLIVENLLIEKYKQLGVFDIFYIEIFIDYLSRYYLNSFHIFFTRMDTVGFKEFNEVKHKIYEVFPDALELLSPICNSIDMESGARLLINELLNENDILDYEYDDLKEKYVKGL